ncbi:phage holin [Lentibacillus sp.]|jgi:SPP1 family holin|uniref:phage holin n=1 Tax=Lentibacillus sp. TaxID=1925746 RepID=UPI002B4B0219|nr:phage holin [Lentibacillus sp.]HLS08068.1 phage holin [Lentibacillus sp.]
MDKGTIVRSAVLVLALVNQFLVIIGKSPLPIDGEQFEQTVSFIFTAVTSVWAWFKNNYVTKTGKDQKKVLMQNGLVAGMKDNRTNTGSDR